MQSSVALANMFSYDQYLWPMKNPDHRPFTHQRETTEFLIRNKRAYVLSDLGTGKTLCPLWAFDILFCYGKVRRMLIICPLSTLRVVWAKEIFNNFPHRKYAVAHGNHDERVRAIRGNAEFVIINHDGIKNVEDEIIRAGFDIVVIDELTAYKNATSERTKCMMRIASKAKAVWGMTAAPTPNSPSEAFGQARVVNPNNPFLPRYFTKFKQMVETEVAPYVWVPKPNAKDIVFQVLQPSVRYERDKCLDLPPVFNSVIELKMSTEQEKAYEAVKRELFYEYQSGQISAVNAAVKLSKLLQIAAGAVKNDDGSILYFDCSTKDNEILETFEELGRTKLLIVSAFRASVERQCQFLKDQKIRCEFIHGDVKEKERARIVNNFQDGDGQILVLQPQTMSHGVTLTAASTLMWQSLTPSGETHLQMNGRITRAGQTKKQYVKYLISCGAERHLYRILTDKLDLSTETLKLFCDEDL